MTSTNWTSTDPSYFDTGDQAWQLTAATLVGLQSIPGLMIMYAGLVKKKWALNSAFMVNTTRTCCDGSRNNPNLSVFMHSQWCWYVGYYGAIEWHLE